MKKIAAIAASVVVALLIPSCGSPDTPIDDVPALAGVLQTLDEAVVAGDYREARAAIRDLKSLTSEALASGTLADPAAQRIMEAAALVAADLRKLQPARHTAIPDPSPAQSQSDPEEEGEDQGEDQDKIPNGDSEKNKNKHGGEPGNSENAPGHNKDE